MASSLEARSPFLDHQLVHFVADIPSSLKLKRGTSKYILKRALRGVLPDKIIDRKKHGFGVPIGAWFRGDLSGYMRSVLLNERSLKRGIWHEQALKEMIEVHMSGKADLGQALWTLLTFELWMQRYFD
jgi:asparagine synthase (glutamine-hydrolysing)